MRMCLFEISDIYFFTVFLFTRKIRNNQKKKLVLPCHEQLLHYTTNTELKNS